MRNIKTVFSLTIAIILGTTAALSAAGEKMYKATGNFIRVNGNTLLLRTQAQDIELIRDADTKIHGTLTQGVSAVVMYDKKAGQPHATDITITPGKTNARY